MQASDARVDGTWCTQSGEKVVITDGSVHWLDGSLGRLMSVSLDSFQMHMDGETYTASLHGGGARLVWSDGDVWSCQVSPL